MIQEDALVQLASEARYMLAVADLTARTVTGVQEQEAAMKSLRSRSNHPVLSPLHHDFASHEAFGIIVEHRGQSVAGMACRRILLGRDKLTSFLRASNKRLYGDGKVVTKAGAADTISGSLTYQGELCLDKKWRGGRAPVAAIMHLAHSLCALKWVSDWHFAFMPVGILNKAPAYGFHRHEICTQTYDKSIVSRSSWECLVYSSGQEICDRASAISGDPKILQELSIKSSS